MRTVLLVDDDPVFLDATSAVLESHYRVRTAGNGTEALAAIGAERPDVLVLDVMMDHLSEGFDLARKLKGDPLTATLPIVMLTGVDQVFNVRMEVGESWVPADRYLEKPVEPEKLLATIAELLA